MLYYHLIVLGCQMNLSDSEKVHAIIESMGFNYTDNEDEAHLLGIMSCSVRQKPINKAYARIQKWNKQKEKRNIMTFITGCVLPEDSKKFLKLFDFVFPTSELSSFPDMIKKYGISSPISIHTDNFNEVINSYFNRKNTNTLKPLKVDNKKKQILIEANENISKLWQIKPNYQSDFEAYVPIQNGCDKFCSYCAVPYTRGREVSRPSNEIIEEVTSLMKKGYKSITLLGQNVNSYGFDNENEISFAQLLEKIGQQGEKLNNPAWVYFTSPHPRDMTNDVIDTISEYKTLAKQIHLPLQSGDDNVLKKMNRKHNLETYSNIVDYIKKVLPQATLFTDIIVGFTGETDNEFANSMKSFDKFKFNMAYIAMYSPRPGAQSYNWADDIPKEVKKERFRLLTDKLKEISLNYNKTLLNKKMQVLIRNTEKKTGYLSGHNEGKIITRILSKDRNLIGSFVDVEITEISDFSITGKIIPN
jgi:tRNA-2-methylthio-N6-dimethylallyladenosine synthase